MEYQQKMRRCHEYVEALEEERRKIQVFQRELPLCLELVTQAIEACRKELSRSTTVEHAAAQQEECSEQTTSGGPVFEEFIPLKRSDLCDNHGELTENKTSDNKKKSDWLRSVQLWNNHDSADPAEDEDLAKNGSGTEVKRNGGAFQPFQRDKSNQSTATPVKAAASMPAPATSSSADTESNKESKGDGKKEEKDGQMERKQRRCWSSELHRRFLHSLQQLGGSHVATPKQIRELMKVDGLTNDEVKSHLQKYRLHTRRPSHVAIHNNGNPQAPQFVVVGGIWVPPPAEYAAMTAAAGSGDAGTPAAIYAPVATVAQPSKPMAHKPKPTWSNDRGHSTDRTARSSSPAGSSSTRTTTASPSL